MTIATEPESATVGRIVGMMESTRVDVDRMGELLSASNCAPIARYGCARGKRDGSTESVRAFGYAKGSFAVPIVDITTVRAMRRFDQTATCEQDGRLYLAATEGTNVDIGLSAAREMRIPGLFEKQRRTVAVRLVSVHVDDPEAFVVAIQRARGAQEHSETEVGPRPRER